MINKPKVINKFTPDVLFKSVGFTSVSIIILILLIFFGFIIISGSERLGWDFLTNLPSRFAEKSGIYTSMAGTIWLMVFTSLIAIPIGILAGVYLEEYKSKNIISKIIEINLVNLAGVPSVVYGLFGLSFFVRIFGMGQSILAGSLTLSLLILPIIIVTTREALKSVPDTIRLASYGLGASIWQTISRQVLGAAMGNIITGIILAISRAIGETAPLIVVGALIYVPFVPSSPMDEYSALPIQIFNWISRPQKEFIINASAGIIVLLFITLLLNGLAVWIRNRYQKKFNW